MNSDRRCPQQDRALANFARALDLDPGLRGGFPPGADHAGAAVVDGLIGCAAKIEPAFGFIEGEGIAHSLYEQSDPFAVYEPEGRLDLTRATYHAIDDRRTRVIGAMWEDATETWVKIEGSRKVGERAVLLCGTADPKFIAQQDKLLKEVEIVVRDLVCEDFPEDHVLTWRVYGIQGVRMTPAVVETPPPEVFIMAECIAPTRERAAEVVRTTKQYLLHHGYEGRLFDRRQLGVPVHAAGSLDRSRLSLQHLSPDANRGFGRAIPVGNRNGLGRAKAGGLGTVRFSCRRGCDRMGAHREPGRPEMGFGDVSPKL